MTGCFVIGDSSVNISQLPWIQGRIVGISSQIRVSVNAAFSFSSIISALSNLCSSAPVTSLANSTFYLRTVLFQQTCAYSNSSLGATIFTSDSSALLGPPGCSQTNPDFVQWANISCDGNCTCRITANGRLGNQGSNQIVGSGQGCLGSWQVTNGWSTGGNYLLGLILAGDNRWANSSWLWCESNSGVAKVGTVCLLCQDIQKLQHFSYVRSNSIARQSYSVKPLALFRCDLFYLSCWNVLCQIRYPIPGMKTSRYC